MATRTLGRVYCPRCGAHHSDVTVMEFTHPSTVGDLRFVGWFTCPTHAEPAMVGEQQVVTA